MEETQLIVMLAEPFMCVHICMILAGRDQLCMPLCHSHVHTCNQAESLRFHLSILPRGQLRCTFITTPLTSSGWPAPHSVRASSSDHVCIMTLSFPPSVLPAARLASLPFALSIKDRQHVRWSPMAPAQSPCSRSASSPGLVCSF